MTRKCTYDKLRGTLKTGDIALFSGNAGVSSLIKLVTNSPWSHVGMILRLTDWDMVLLWESTTLGNVHDIDTGRRMRGVQLVPLSERLRHYHGEIAVRKLSRPIKRTMHDTLQQFRRQLGKRPYEKRRLELLRAAYDGPAGHNAADLSSVFCSELVAESYQRIGLLPAPPRGLPSNEFTPKDFSTHAPRPLPLCDGYELGDEIAIAR